MVKLKECASAAGNVIGSCFPQQRWHVFTHYIIFWDLNTSEYKKVHQKLSVCKVPRSCGDRTMPPSTALDSWYEAFVLMLPLFGFTACAYFFKNISTSGCLKYTVSDVCGLLRCNFPNKLFFSFQRFILTTVKMCSVFFFFSNYLNFILVVHILEEWLFQSFSFFFFFSY